MDIKVYKIVNSIYNSNTYIIYNDSNDYVWLVDCGDVEPIVKWLELNNKTLKGVFITHTHYDHIYGLNKLKDIYSDLVVYTSKNGLEGLKSDVYNLSKYHDDFFIYDNKDVVILEDKSEIMLFDREKLVSYSTPGHDWSCLTYKIINYIFTGDSYIPGLKVVTSFPKSSRKKSKESLDLIKSLLNDKVIIYSGHTVK